MVVWFGKIDLDNLMGKDDLDNLIGKDDLDNLIGEDWLCFFLIKIIKKWWKIWFV